jgi:hypothetical protein
VAHWACGVCGPVECVGLWSVEEAQGNTECEGQVAIVTPVLSQHCAILLQSSLRLF